MEDTPVVFLEGARQVGKSTLAKDIGKRIGAAYLTLDDHSERAAAIADPVGFIEDLPRCAIIDEVQLVPELFRSIKQSVDEDRRPGRLLLTGSTRALSLPRLADALVGRFEVLTLWPFSAGELSGHREGFLDALVAADFDPPFETGSRFTPETLLGTGFPEPQRRDSARRRAWFRTYVTAALDRDIRQLADIDRRADLHGLLTVIASRPGATLNVADLSRDLAIPQTSIKRFLSLFSAIHLIWSVRAWSTSGSRRLIKAPRLRMVDQGLVAHLMRLSEAALETHPELQGSLLEDQVIRELAKQISYHPDPPDLYHYRSRLGAEVDAVLHFPNGDVIGIEVKRGRTVGGSDFRGLRHLAETCGERFRRGLVLHNGDRVRRFGEGMYAVPLSALKI